MINELTRIDALGGLTDPLGVLRIENAGLKRQLQEAAVEIAALKRAREQAADDVTKILTVLQAE